jgi:hypothetical protein
VHGLEKGALREKGLSERGCTIVGVWTRGGRTKERGHTCPRASPNISRILQGGRIYKWAKEKASQGKGKQQGKEAKGLARKEGHTKAMGAFIHGLAGTSTRDSKASKIGFYCTRFTCCIYALRSLNIYI